jgi:predicted RNA-binding Zn-ribbon protein involved in translation (DUF1610 family)
MSTPILSARGVTADMRFQCSDCGEVTTGEEILSGERIFIVKTNINDLHRSIWRCANCQDDVEDYQRE